MISKAVTSNRADKCLLVFHSVRDYFYEKSMYAQVFIKTVSADAVINCNISIHLK